MHIFPKFIYTHIYIFMLQACSVPDFDGVVKDLLVSHQMIGCMGVGPAIFFPYIYIYIHRQKVITITQHYVCIVIGGYIFIYNIIYNILYIIYGI